MEKRGKHRNLVGQKKNARWISRIFLFVELSRKQLTATDQDLIYKLSEAWQPVRKSQMGGVFFHPTKGRIPDFG